jgi:hypothetical protein
MQYLWTPYHFASIVFCLCQIALSPIAINSSAADVQVKVEVSSSGSSFRFRSIPLPAIDDAGAGAQWKVIAGQLDSNSGPLERLSDGQIPVSADQPSQNVFFAAGTQHGMIAVDLGMIVELSEIVTYSWHPENRAPQVYTVYAATGDEPDFDFPQSVEVIAGMPQWTKIASADTRSAKRNGGQHAARIYRAQGTIGKFRHLVFVVNATQPDDRFSHTFFSEVDIIAASAESIQRIKVPDVREISFATVDDAFHFTIDVTQAQELEEWTTEKLKPVILDWYPKIVAMLPSEGFEAARDIRFQFLRDEEMKGIPAYASGATISMNAEWFRGQLNGEARGAVVHEMVHVVQNYPGRNRRVRGPVAPPGWIVEGIPDYIRWFLYEPQTGGAALSPARLKDAKHDASYRTSANFIDWVIRNHPNDGRFLEQLNAVAREGRYSGETWKELTGRTEQELADLWRQGP